MSECDSSDNPVTVVIVVVLNFFYFFDFSQTAARICL